MSDASEQLGPWSVALGDQLSAAAQQGDWEVCAQLGVDGYMQAFAIDNEAEVPYSYALESVNELQYTQLVMICAEALRQLYRRGGAVTDEDQMFKDLQDEMVGDQANELLDKQVGRTRTWMAQRRAEGESDSLYDLIKYCLKEPNKRGMSSAPTARPWCGWWRWRKPMDVDLTPKKAGGALGYFFCSSPHPTVAEVWCRRQPDHDGRCAAFVHSIAVPDEWDRL